MPISSEDGKRAGGRPEVPGYNPCVTLRDVPSTVVDSSTLETPGAVAVDRRRIAEGVRLILEAIGEDPGRPGLLDTPQRVAESFAHLFSGVGVDPATVLDALPGERATGLIMVREIPLAGICEHHLLPFVGRAAVAYYPGADGRICGLSKLARLIDVLSRRPQVQERLVAEAADALERALAPSGVFVVAEAEHLCMTMRGAEKPGSITVTTEVRGLFAADAGLRSEALMLASGRHRPGMG